MIFAVTRCEGLTVAACLLGIGLLPAAAQSASSGAASPSAAAERAIKMAVSGHCAEAVPELRKAARSAASNDLKKLAGLHGLRCSMIRNQAADADDFLQALRRSFPHDPEVLYQATPAYADLSHGPSAHLMRKASFPYHQHELMAENLEPPG